MRANYICCIGKDQIGRAACYVIAYKCPGIRVTILDKMETYSEWEPDVLSFYEPDLKQIIKKCRNRNLFFTSDYLFAIKEADLIFLCLNIPVVTAFGTEGKTLDFTELEDAAKLIAIHSESDKIIVEKTNVSVRTVGKLSTILKSYCRTGVRYTILSNPEFISDGPLLKELLNPEHIVIACTNNPSGRAGAESLCEIYEQWVPRKNIIIINYSSSELYKMVMKAFIAQKLCSTNSLALICERSGADFSELAKILSRDCRLGSKNLKASFGFGGFQKDLSNFIILCESLKLPEVAQYWKAVLDLNNYHIQKFNDKIQSILSPLEGKIVTVLGFSYKKSTWETKYSPAIDICKWLLKENCYLRIYDPKVKSETIMKELELLDDSDRAKNVQVFTDVHSACNDSSAVIICTDRDEFIQLNFSELTKSMKTPIIIDGRKCLNGDILKNLGVEYHTIGLGTTALDVNTEQNIGFLGANAVYGVYNDIGKIEQCSHNFLFLLTGGPNTKSICVLHRTFDWSFAKEFIKPATPLSGHLLFNLAVLHPDCSSAPIATFTRNSHNQLLESEKMSGTKIAMPQPNSFQSGALSFMSCTSGRESSPLDENDSHQAIEFKTETKKKRFHPLRNLRRMFRRKTRRSSISADSYQPGGLGSPEITSTNLEHRSCSTSRLQEENLTQNLIRNNRLSPGLSLSHDSIFTPDRADSGLSSSDLENSSLSITVITSPSKECPIKSQSSCSESSLLSIGSSEIELSPARNNKISDLDLGVTTYKLSHSAAKHKMAVRPRRNHGAPRSRRRTMTSKSPLPITIEVIEEGATGRNSPPLEIFTSVTSESYAKCDKRPQDTKTSWNDIAMDSTVEESEEKANEHVKVMDETDAKEEEVVTQRTESFFGRFLSRRSDKKKKLIQESNTEENNDDKSHFGKKPGKNAELKGGARKTPNRRQRIEPVEIPSSPCGHKFEKEKEDFDKKTSTSISPPKSYWPLQATSRSMSPPKIIWPENANYLKSEEPALTSWDKVSVNVSPTKQLFENVLKDWKNPNFVKELTDSVSLFAKEKSNKKEKDEEEEEETFLARNQHSNEIASPKSSISVECISVLENESKSSESVESTETENVRPNAMPTKSETNCLSIKTHNAYPISFETIHDGYENIQIIEQVKQEVKNSTELLSVMTEIKSVPSPGTENSIEVDFIKIKEVDIQNSDKEPEVVKRIKPAVSEKPKDLRRLGVPEFIKINFNGGEQKSPEESDSKAGVKVKNTLVERRKSELMLLTESEENEWKGKIKILKKPSFSDTSKEKVNHEASQKSPARYEKETSTEKTELAPEVAEEVVIFRKKSVANTSEEQPELMKVFARRSLKVKESEKMAEELQRSRDSDKENEIVDSPKEDRKKAIVLEKVEKKETESVISKEGVRAVSKGKANDIKMCIAPLKPEIISRKNVFQRYGRSLSENNAKPKEETEFKRDPSVLEESNVNKLRMVSEKTISCKFEKGENHKGKEEEEEEGEKEEETGFKRIQQRKAEWERRAQQGAK